MSNLAQKEGRSLSQSHLLKANVVHVTRTGSQSTEKVTEKKYEDLEEQTVLQRVIDRLPTGEYQWKMTPLEQKRNIPGLKSRLEWVSTKRNIHAVFKFSFTTNFFKPLSANYTIYQGDVIVELEQITFELSANQKQKFQERIEEVIEGSLQKIKTKILSEDKSKNGEFIKLVLSGLAQELEKTSESRRKVSADKVETKNISKRHILYPAPATLAWNPLGSLCITQNRIPKMRKPLIGEPLALTKYFEAGILQTSAEEANNQNDNLQAGEGNKHTMYDWNVDDEVYLIIFNRKQSKIDQYSNSRGLVEQETGHKRQQDKIGSDNIDLGALSRLPPKLRRTYQRFFGEGERTPQFHRYDKLKVYDILTLSQEDEDDIIFLTERIASRPADTLTSEITFQNHFILYPSLLSSPMDRLKYDILAKQLKEQITDPELKFGAFLRMFVLENDYFSDQLQSYFKQQYRILGLVPFPQISGLGSYSKFDRAKAEWIFMNILRAYLTRNEDVAKVKVRGVHVRRRPCPARLHLQSVVNDDQKETFLLSLFPLLIVKDREMERFEFKKIKKIVSANARITSFIKKMNDLVIKFEQGRTIFLRTVVEQFFSFRQDLKDLSIKPHRYFISTCTNCRKVTYFYTLPNLQEAQFCQRCKSRSYSEIF